MSNTHAGDWVFNVRQQERARHQAWGNVTGSGAGHRRQGPEMARAYQLMRQGLCGYQVCREPLLTHLRCVACGILAGEGHWTERLVGGLCDGCRYAERRELWDDGVRL